MSLWTREVRRLLFNHLAMQGLAGTVFSRPQ
jgi:hypothetical protein